MEAHSQLPFLTNILLLLVLARLLGEVFNRFKQSAVIGEILAGILLGPAVLGFIAPSAHLEGIAELSIFLILLAAGLEMDFGSVIKAFLGKGAILGTVSFAIPMGGGVLLGLTFLEDITHTVFLALCLAITALPVILRILEDFDLKDSSVGRYSVGTAIFNDIAALFCLGAILDMPVEKGWGPFFESLTITGWKFAAFAFVIVSVSSLLTWGGRSGTGIIQRALEGMIHSFGKETLFGVIVLFALVIGAMSEAVGGHFVIGVFFAGLLINRSVIGDRLLGKVEATLNSVSKGFLAPIFFGLIGLQFTWETFRTPVFTFAVIVVSIGSKLLATRLSGGLARVSKAEALGVGVLLNSRGTMDLVVANIAYQGGFIKAPLFSTLVLLSIVSTLLTPILFKRNVYAYLPKPSEETEGEASPTPDETSGETAPPAESPTETTAPSEGEAPTEEGSKEEKPDG